jgi:hypothetical protein
VQIIECDTAAVHFKNITENFNAIMEELEKIPDWVTTGITYLLPKSRNGKEVRNYQPTTCLTTMHKTLTGIIARRIYTYLEELNLLPEEQKGCHPGSERCKDQLMILYAKHEDCKRRKKNLSMAWIDLPESI